MRNPYQEVIYALDGSNISGIAISLVEAIGELKDNGVTGEALNTHPIIKLYAAKLIEMTQMGLADQEAFGDAYHVCKQRAESLDATEVS